MQTNEILRSLREDADLTQDELASKLQVSRKQIIRWEQGSAEMGINKLKALCLIYKVSADYILGLEKGLHWPR